MIKALIFDLDGVIVDTAKYHFIAWRKLANDLGFDFTEKDNERLKGVSRMTSLDILLEIGGKKLGKEEKRLLAEKKNKNYREYITQMKPSEILPGVMDFLEDIKSKGYKTAIGSASKNTPTILEQIGLSTFFDAVIDGNKISKAKPAPEVFLKGAEELQVMPKECIVFEDAQAGIEAALNGNMYAIGVGDARVLSKAHFVIKSFEGLSMKDLLLKLVFI